MNNKTPYNTHELKILPKWFEDVLANKKNFEIRKNDRNYKVGDYLVLKEWYRGKFTDRYVIRQIEYIYKGDGTYGLSEEYCVLGLKLPPVTPTQKWIPVSERLPEERGMYIATEKVFSVDDKKHTGRFNLMTEQVEFNNGKWWRASFYEVIAWMPLPEPYKAEMENEE